MDGHDPPLGTLLLNGLRAITKTVADCYFDEVSVTHLPLHNARECGGPNIALLKNNNQYSWMSYTPVLYLGCSDSLRHPRSFPSPEPLESWDDRNDNS